MNAVFIGALFLFFGDFGILSSSNKLQILQSHDFFVTFDLQMFCVYEN